MAQRGQVLVAIVNHFRDLDIAREEHWYRIPVASQHRRLRDRWPPKWLAFYQTKVFGPEAYAVRYYARVIDIRQVRRSVLFPGDQGPNSRRMYHQLRLAALETLPVPILSRRFRRIVFIPTTWPKLMLAEEINDLYDESPLEDKLWSALKRHRIPAARQEWVKAGGNHYCLDFALYCMDGSLDVETDGDTWHTRRDRTSQDRARDNALAIKGWSVLRFSTSDVLEMTESYCIDSIRRKINVLGGLDEGWLVGRKIPLDLPPGSRQLTLFDDQAGYDP